MSERINWNWKFMGKFKEEPRIIFTNSEAEMRYSIEIISYTIPESLPNEATRYLTSFSKELTPFAFVDNVNISEEERKRNLKAFLDEHYLAFKIKSKPGKDEGKFYNAYDIEVFPRETDKEENFLVVPLIKSNTENVDELLERLNNNEFLKSQFAISDENNDYPSFVLIAVIDNKYPHNYLEVEEYKKVIAFGPIEGVQYDKINGFKFITGDKQNFCKELNLSDLGEFYTSNENVIFITVEKDDEIRRLLQSEGESPVMSIKNVKEIEEVEKEFLECFENVALSKGLSFQLTDLYNFHTAMKTQNMVILAGMSGTGKSQIIQCYQKALNKFSRSIEESSSNQKSKLLFIPVRPFWQDDSDLLGYLDSSQGIYRPGETGLIDFIIEANNNPEECYIVCLDEMNLAKVEHYFSQFLSVLERDLEERCINLYNDKLFGRIYNQVDYPPQIKLTENLFFVGTINTDESTYQLSDKVLDRFNVISLGLCNFKDVRERITAYRNTIKKIDNLKRYHAEKPLKTFNKLMQMKYDCNEEVLNSNEISFLWDINKLIQEHNEHIGIGYRIIAQIENYMGNLPKSEIFTRQQAIDFQLKQRILTKLRGSHRQLAPLVGDFRDGKYIEGKLIEKMNDCEEISDFKLTKEKLKSLAKELVEYGHTI